MASLKDLAGKIKSSLMGKLNDNEGWFRGGQFTPIQQIKPLAQTLQSNFSQNVRQIPTIANNFLRDQTQKVEQGPVFSPSLPQTVGNIGTKFITSQLKNTLYNPDTQKLFPSSPFRSENAPLPQGFLSYSPEKAKQFVTSNVGIQKTTQPIVGMLGGTPQSIATQTILSKSRANMIKQAEPEISSMIKSINNLEKFSPEAQMKIMDQAEALAKKIVPDIIKRPEFKATERVSKSDYFNTIAKALEDRLMTAFNPQLNIGNNVRKLQKVANIKPTNLAETKLPPIQSQTQLKIQKPQPGRVKIAPEGTSLPNVTTPSGKIPIGSTSKYNTSNIKIKNKSTLTQAIDEVKPSFEKIVGGPLTHKEILKQSEQFSDEIVKAVGRKTTEQLGAAQLRIRQNIARMADEGKVTPELLDQLRADASFGRSTAQLFGQRRIEASPRTEFGKNMLKYIEEVSKVADDMDSVYAAAKGVDFNDVNQAAEFYRKFVQPKASDWIDKVRYSSMLSSPNTTINNASINLQGTGLLTPIEKTVTGIVDAITNRGQRQNFVGEGIEYAKGYASNIKPALTKLFETMKGGSDASEMFSIPLTKQGTAGRAVETTFSIPQRIQQAVDEFFGVLTRGGLEKANVYRTAQGGVSQTPEMIAEEAKRRLFNQPFGSDQSTVLNWLEYIPSKIMEATHSKNPLLKWSSKVVFPFVRIPANVVKAGVEYSPVGFSTMIGAPNKAEQASKAMMGTATALGAFMLAQGDRLTGAPPTSEKQKTAQKAAGIQPYSIKIGDKWYSYEKTHPIVAFNFAMAAGVKDQMEKQTIDDDQLDNVMNIFGNWMKYVANQSYMKQVGTLVDLAEGNKTAATQFFSNAVTQVIPYKSLMGWIARALDPNERKVDPDGSVLDKALGSIILSIPGLRNNLPPLLDESGNPVAQQGRFVNLVSPIKVTQENQAGREMFDIIKDKSIQTSKDNAITDKLKRAAGSEVAQLSGTGRYAWFDKKKGEIVKVDISEPIAPPEYTGDESFDKTIKSQYKSELNARKKDIVLLLQKGILTKEEAVSLMDDVEAQLVGTGTGGGSGRSGRAIKITSPPFKTPLLTQTKSKFTAPTQINYTPAPVTKLKTPRPPKNIKIALRAPKKKPIKIKEYRNTLIGK